MTNVYPQKIDWGRILDELRAAGVSTYRVAMLLGKDWDTVNGWRRHEPRHCDGEALLRLHSEACKASTTNSADQEI